VLLTESYPEESDTFSNRHGFLDEFRM